MNKKNTFLIIAQFFAVFMLFAEQPILTDVNAVFSDSNKITITWSIPSSPRPEIEKILVYRSKKPIGTYSDICNDSPITVLSNIDTAWTDSVADFNDYYYAVIAQTAGRNYDIILPSINSTVNGVHVKIAQQKSYNEKKVEEEEKTLAQGTLREMPLPYLDLTGEKNKKKVNMNEETLFVAKELAGTKKASKTKNLAPYIFEEVLISPAGGDDYLLFDVLRTSFIKKEYKESSKQLSKLLETNLSETVTDRATFYLAQSFYFNSEYDKAVKTFILVYNKYPSLTKKWIDSSLEKYSIPQL